MEFAKIGNFYMLTNCLFQLDNFLHQLGSNRAVVDMYDNDYVLTRLLSMSEENGLVDGTLGETQFINQNLDKPLVPTSTTLLQAIQGLAKTTDFVGMVRGLESWGLVHVDCLVISEFSI